MNLSVLLAGLAVIALMVAYVLIMPWARRFDRRVAARREAKGKPRSIVPPWSSWEDYLYWQGQDRRTLKRLNLLIEDILRDDPFEGVGKPEPLKHALAGAWSRRIDEANRLVYLVDDAYVIALQARYRY